ncbi:hypothetical protein SAICODRAFT_147247 [Saitoella complicata NRRL Y-17804]|uniref:uncharacterized protein n=1 Tax=Saitoella complicata (strain BCRC 22490 / CBS 7301 / JCM 7358 / NBRC 10748 / NRRL Y-17804) TaxID=698492 RepID=UPI0008680DDE|nr:uncharacterized protein SAICODRAFT_147247 [Saitoella complicata NRRL Y-17804]ODQ51586.1 hypothetical protein SAICODRAFT_147247 [Saitoella complicata NRRL Y-17804]
MKTTFASYIFTLTLLSLTTEAATPRGRHTSHHPSLRRRQLIDEPLNATTSSPPGDSILSTVDEALTSLIPSATPEAGASTTDDATDVNRWSRSWRGYRVRLIQLRRLRRVSSIQLSAMSRAWLTQLLRRLSRLSQRLLIRSRLRLVRW